MNKATNKIKVAGYARISSLKQIGNYSISAQLAEVEKYCTLHDYEMTSTYIDNGISGAAMNNRLLYNKCLKI